MGKCPLITIILKAAVSGLLLWLTTSGFTKFGEEIGFGAMRNKEKADLVAGSRPSMDLNYASERRVPRGPDPIHNRRVGNSRKPPGQA